MTTFTHAGVSRLNGQFKVRFANDAARVKVLIKSGHKDIDLIELKHAMTKEDAVAYLMSIDFANGNTEVQAALETAVERRSTPTPKAANKEQKPKKEAKKPKKAAAPKQVKTKDPAVQPLTVKQAEELVGEALL